MKRQITIIVLGGIAALSIYAFTAPSPQGCGNHGGAMQHEEHQAQKPSKAKIVKGVQVATIKVDSGKYSPSSIAVVRDKPVELTFKLGRKPGCASELVIEDLKFRETIDPKKGTIVKFTPSKEGAIKFACGMGMQSGTIIVQ
ncbi:MAG: cupredoxin domain-containing protein [Armatimonadetes bacterium]|nr:cupredoxin domain-containing protein [Armatimonadota bacterium]